MTAKRLVSTQNSERPATVDLIECRYVSWNRYQCHNLAYSSYPASVTTDFYVRDCDNAIQSTVTRVGYPSRYVDLVDNVEAGHTKGLYTYRSGWGTHLIWSPVTLDTPPVIDCGPEVDGFHHVTNIELSQINNDNK